MNWKAVAGTTVEPNFLLLFGFNFWKKASNKGGVWRGSLPFSETHLAKGWTPPERSVQLLITMWFSFFSSEAASAVREVLWSILPSWDSRDTRKWTNLPWAWFYSFWLSSINGLNHGSLSSGYCGSYGNVLREAAWQPAAQRGAWGPKCSPGSRESWHPKMPVLSGACLFSLLLWN